MQLNGINYCDYCFTPISPGQGCSRCGITAANYNLPVGLLPPGANLNGKYIIGRVLGRGGFGATYMAYSSAQKRAVAIKEYLPVSISYRGRDEETVSVVSEDQRGLFEKGARRFYEEAQMLSKFHASKSIVTVYELFTANNTMYYSMDYLEGVDLKHYIREHGGRVNEAMAIRVFVALCNAMMVVHSARIMHRDIAPDNVFMENNGNIRLIDFGAAKQVINNAQSGLSVVLKQGFAPPEQYKRDGNQGPWTDIYAAGATVYYALTGQVPPDLTTRFENPKLYFEPDKRPSAMLEAIINKCMSMSITGRYQSAVEVLGDLIKISSPLSSYAAQVKPQTVPGVAQQSTGATQQRAVNNGTVYIDSNRVVNNQSKNKSIFVDEEHMDMQKAVRKQNVVSTKPRKNSIFVDEEHNGDFSASVPEKKNSVFKKPEQNDELDAMFNESWKTFFGNS